MKQLVNDPTTVVDEALDALTSTSPHLGLLRKARVVFSMHRLEQSERDEKVAVICGGGSGHEPSHSGYVGKGFLAAAVCGNVFTSPPPSAVLAAIRKVTGKAGALLVVKNYTGDVLNFTIAQEQARLEGLAVDMVVVGDDCASRDAGPGTGRGVAGTVLVNKIASAAASEGLPLSDVVQAARRAAAGVHTMGVALSGCTVPGAKAHSFTLESNEIEVGLGIHGEAGIRREVLPEHNSANHVSRILVETVLKSGSFEPQSRVAYLLNGLGSTTPLELGVMNRALLALLKSSASIVPERILSGNFMTALEMAGVSLTLLHVDDDFVRWIDQPCEVQGWPQMVGRMTEKAADAETDQRVMTPTRVPAESLTPLPASTQVVESIKVMVKALVDAADTLTEMDRVVGDGDMGISLQRGCAAVVPLFDRWSCISIGQILRQCGNVIQQAIAGSSGPLIAILLLRMASAWNESTLHDSLPRWTSVFEAGVNAVSSAGGAVVGDCTMVDPLFAAVTALKDAVAQQLSAHDAAEKAAAAAEKASDECKGMRRKRGRGRYLGERAIGHADPGAHAVAVALRALASSIPPPPEHEQEQQQEQQQQEPAEQA